MRLFGLQFLGSGCLLVHELLQGEVEEVLLGLLVFALLVHQVLYHKLLFPLIFDGTSSLAGVRATTGHLQSDALAHTVVIGGHV